MICFSLYAKIVLSGQNAVILSNSAKIVFVILVSEMTHTLNKIVSYAGADLGRGRGGGVA